MLRDQYIKNFNEIKGFFTKDEKVSDTILDFYQEFFNKGVLRGINAIKKRGYEGKDILLDLLLLPFYSVSSIRALILSGMDKITNAEKDVYYRFKNRSDINWRKLHSNIAKRFVKLSEQYGEGSTGTLKCFIADDTTLRKSGKKIEFIGKVYDHVSQRMVLGFKMLTVGYWDGKSFIPIDFSLHNEKGNNKKRPFGLSMKESNLRFHKERGADSAGLNRVRELRISKIVNTVKMIKRAVKNGFKADYVLTDKWFMNDSFIRSIIKIKKGMLHLVGLCKMDNRKYDFDGKQYSAKQLLKLKKNHSKRSRKINARYIEIDVVYKGIKLKLFFSRYSKRGNWQLLATTDLSLSYNKAVEIYNIRWSIEVYFKESKQYLNLGRSESNDFDGQIADATISMIQYIVLSLNKRFSSYETMGELFRKSQKELIELTIVNRMWGFFMVLQQKMVEMFEIDMDTFHRKVINDEEYGKILILLFEQINQQFNEKCFNNAA